MPWINEVSKHTHPFWPLPCFCHEPFLLSAGGLFVWLCRWRPQLRVTYHRVLGVTASVNKFEKKAHQRSLQTRGSPSVTWLSWCHDAFPNRKIFLSQILSIHFFTCPGIHHTWHQPNSSHWPTMNVAIFSMLTFTKQHWLEEGLANILSGWRQQSKCGWAHGMGRTKRGAETWWWWSTRAAWPSLLDSSL